MKYLHYWLPVFLWMGVIFYFSTRQRVQVSEQQILNFLFFKSLHLIEYFVLYVLSFRAFSNNFSTKKKKVYQLAFILTVLYAVTDEIHQMFIPTREGKPRDVIIDAAGASFAWLSIYYVLPRVPQRLRKLVGDWGIHI